MSGSMHNMLAIAVDFGRLLHIGPEAATGELVDILSLVRRFSQTPFSQEGDLVRWAPRSRFLHAHVRCAVMAPSPKAPVLPVLQVHLLNGHTSFVFEHRLSAGTRVTSHHGILHDFHHQATTSCTTHELSLF